MPIGRSSDLPYYRRVKEIKTFMSYEVTIAGIVHSVDPIMSPKAYAKATFNYPDDVSVAAEGKKLYFTCYTKETVEGSFTIEDLTKGILKGDDRNVEWDLKVKPQR